MATVHPATRKVARFGVETPQNLVWRGWEPGREYTKPLVLKNIQFKTQKLKFRYLCTYVDWLLNICVYYIAW